MRICSFLLKKSLAEKFIFLRCESTLVGSLTTFKHLQTSSILQPSNIFSEKWHERVLDIKDYRRVLLTKPRIFVSASENGKHSNYLSH